MIRVANRPFLPTFYAFWRWWQEGNWATNRLRIRLLQRKYHARRNVRKCSGPRALLLGDEPGLQSEADQTRNIKDF